MARIAITLINLAETLAAEARRTGLSHAVRARPELSTRYQLVVADEPEDGDRR